MRKVKSKIMHAFTCKNKATRNTFGTTNSVTHYPDPLRAPPPDATFLQAPSYITKNYKTPADYIARPRHIKPGNLCSTEHNRSEMGLTIGCLEKRTDCTALINRK